MILGWLQIFGAEILINQKKKIIDKIINWTGGKGADCVLWYNRF